MPYCDGSAMRCEAVLKVAFDAWSTRHAHAFHDVVYQHVSDS